MYSFLSKHQRFKRTISFIPTSRTTASRILLFHDSPFASYSKESVALVLVHAANFAYRDIHVGTQRRENGNELRSGQKEVYFAQNFHSTS